MELRSLLVSKSTNNELKKILKNYYKSLKNSVKIKFKLKLFIENLLNMYL